MARRTVNEAVQLVHKTSEARQVFVPGEEVPPVWLVPDEFLVELPDLPAPAAEGEGDEDDEDTEDDEEDSSGLGNQLDGAFLDLTIDVATSSIAQIEAAVAAVDPEYRDEAARWVLSEESRRPEPRITLLGKMQALLP